MTKNKHTPIVDKAAMDEADFGISKNDWIKADIAREIERKLHAIEADIEQLIEKLKQAHKRPDAHLAISEILKEREGKEKTDPDAGSYNDFRLQHPGHKI